MEETPGPISHMHFDQNVENVLNSLSQLKERIINPKQIEDPNEEIKTTISFLKLVCTSNSATQTSQEAATQARTYVFENYLKNNGTLSKTRRRFLVLSSVR